MRKGVNAICLTFFSLLLFVPPVLAQRASQFRVDGDRIKSYIEYLSTDEMQGRKSCTDGYRRAAEWVASKFEEWGLEPAGENGTYFQRVPIGRYFTLYTGIPELRVNGKAFSINESDFSVGTASTVVTTIDAEIVFVGYGISAPDKGLDEYVGINVRGKVVLALKGSPKDAPRAGGGFMGPGRSEEPEPEEEWEEESKDGVKIQTAYDKGAAAILLYDPDEGSQSTGSSFMGRRAEQAAMTPTRDFLSFTITGRVFRAIMKPDPQESVRGFTTRLNAIRNDIKIGKVHSDATGARAHLMGYDSATRISEELDNSYARNVIAKIPGTDRRRRNEYIIMGGHLDHLGVSNGQVYNGADDNASGTAVVMEVARVLKEGNFRPRRTIIFCAWCGEELGLIGSYYYGDNPCDGVTMDNVVTYFNMDMVGLGDAIGAPGALNFPSIWEVIKRDQDEDVMAAVQPSTGGPGGSDQSAFIARGIEAMALMTRGGVGHPYYHRPEDDTPMMEPEILRKTGQFVIQGTMNLAIERRVNLLIEDRLNIYNALLLNIDSFNPGVAEGNYRYVEIDAGNRNDLVQIVLDSALVVYARQREQAPVQPQLIMRMRRSSGSERMKKSFYRGISDLGLFEGDTQLLSAASEFIGFGRVDVEGNDGYWFSGGQLTSSGHEALKVMEGNSIFVHLVSPSQNLITEMLAASSKPFIITGDYSVIESMVDQINEKGIVLGVTMDPANVKECIADLEGMKALLGDTDNLVLCVTSNEGVDDAKKALYMGLIDKGWTHLEIAGERRRGGGIAGGNLVIFTRGGGRFGR